MESVTAHAARKRIQVEYIEMPDLKLTRAQLGRLCGVPPGAREEAVSDLLRSGFLSQTADGSFMRRGAEHAAEDRLGPRYLAPVDETATPNAKSPSAAS